MPLFSVVIPVYNAQEFLSECLDSLEGQTFRDFEVICINDGSTDSSRNLLIGRTASDERIRVIDQVNGGPSSARNAGIVEAAGDFITFLDSDDLFEHNALERIAQAINAKTDAVIFGWSCFGGVANQWTESQGNTPDAFYPCFEPQLAFDEPTQPHLRLAIRRNALMEQSIRFDEALTVGEDGAFLLSAYPRIGGVKIISDKLYRYRLPHDGSLMNGFAGNDVQECLHGLDADISIFNDWSNGGFLDRFGAELVAWTIKNPLYTMLRQEPQTRTLLVSTLADLWRAHWSDEELRALDMPSHAKRLMEHALDPYACGIKRDLAIYRLAEYGVADIATTIYESITHIR